MNILYRARVTNPNFCNRTVRYTRKYPRFKRRKWNHRNT